MGNSNWFKQPSKSENMGASMLLLVHVKDVQISAVYGDPGEQKISDHWSGVNILTSYIRHVIVHPKMALKTPAHFKKQFCFWRRVIFGVMAKG